jgi:tetratricopeptide (TPR) repeat protein
MFLSILACNLSASHLEKAREAAAGGDVDVALEEYHQALEEDAAPEDKFMAFTERGELYHKQEEWDAAVADYSAALKVTQEDGRPVGDQNLVYMKRAEVYLTQEDWTAVVADLDQVLAQQPDHYEALARRGYAHLQLRNFEEAIKDLKASLQGDVVAANAELDNKRNLLDAYYRLAEAMRQLGEFNQAVQYYGEALTLAQDKDDQAEILAARGFVYSELNDNEKALADLDQALALQPEMALAYAYRSYVYGDLADYEAAIADATKAVELGSDLSDQRRASVIHARALAYLSLEQYEQAITDATESINLAGADTPETARTYDIRSNAYFALGDYERAIADASKAIELGTTDITALSDFHRTRAYAYYFAGNYEAARADIEAAISLDNAQPDADDFGLLGRIQYAQSDHQAAIQSFQQALSLAADDPWLHSDLGDIYYELENLEMAEAEYRAAIQGDPEVALFHENLGLILRLTERYAEAAQSYTRALELDDQRPYSWLGRGFAHYYLEQDETAIADLEKAMTFELEPDVVEVVEGVLSEIRP